MSYRTMRAAALLACCAWAAAGEEPAYTPRPKDTLTWSRDIAPIVYKHCASCHRPGEVAPFPLLEYKDAAKRDVQIALAVESRLMPPWKPAPGYGSFHDERRLSADEIGAIRQWVDEGAREGDPKDLPAQPKFTEGWQLGEPDLVVEMPEAFTCPAEGRDVYRNFVLPVPLKEERYVRAVEFRPGNRAVVHHAILYLDTSGWARKRDEADPAPGYASLGGPGIIPSGGLGGWTPGATVHPYPDGVAKTLAPGTDIVAQLHFHPTGKPETERCKIGLYFASKPPTRTMAALTLLSRKIDIPAGEKNYRVSDKVETPVDVDAIGIIPHAHLLAKEIKAVATLPDGTKKDLLWIDDWDFNWQGSYSYKDPVRLPKGTSVEMSFRFDNSAENANNPNNPPRRVRWGEQTTDEMAILWLQVLPADEKDAEELKRSVGRTFLGAFAGGEISSGLGARIGGGILDRVLKGLDADGDGVLSAAEEAKLAGGFEKLSARAGEQLKPLLRQLDADGNGKLDAAEIEKLRQRLKEASKAK